MLEGKRILLGVTGGIAAYKAADLCSRLRKQGAEVRVVVTEHAARFVTPTTFQALSGHPVGLDLFAVGDAWAIEHITLAKGTDLAIVAPATANFLAKMAAGIADDLLSTTLLALDCPVLVAPAMNPQMFTHPSVQANLATLRERGVGVLEPGTGLMACGDTGPGRLPEPEDLVRAIADRLSATHDLQGVRLLVTAGPTQEPFDAVRYISNPSSGKMGYAVAAAARKRGADVTLVSGPTLLSDPEGVRVVRVQTAEEMHRACLEVFSETDWMVSAAAVSDYRPASRVAGKLKKEEGDLTVILTRTPDILAELGQRKRPGQVLCGFAAETADLEANARAKLSRKNLDLIVANDVSQPDAGFGVDTNRADLLDAAGGVEALPLLSKEELAHRILDRMKALAARRPAAT